MQEDQRIKLKEVYKDIKLKHFKDKDDSERAMLKLSFPLRNAKNYQYNYPINFNWINIDDLIISLNEFKEMWYNTVKLGIEKYDHWTVMRWELTVWKNWGWNYLLTTKSELT